MRLKLAHGVGVVHQVELKGDKASLGGWGVGESKQGAGAEAGAGRVSAWQVVQMQMWLDEVCTWGCVLD